MSNGRLMNWGRAALLTTAVAAGALSATGPAAAADPSAGAKIAETCSACHGAGGISTGDPFPHLAGQREVYLVAQLEAFQAGDRKSEIMQAIAAGLSAQEVADVAAFYAAQPGATPGAKGASQVALTGDTMPFPADYKGRLQRYTTIDFPATKQVRFYWGDPASLVAAKAGAPFPAGSTLLVEIFTAKLDAAGMPEKGPDGHFVPDRHVGFTGMVKQPGLGEPVPDLLRNGDWRYAAFAPDGTPRTINEGPCLACHKPHTDTDYTFTRAAMAAR